jgi:predicted RecA/RadA family phage recombinase
VIDPSTNIGALVAVGEIAGTAMLTLAAGDVVTLVNNSLIAFTMSLDPNIGAQLNIIQLS